MNPVGKVWCLPVRGIVIPMMRRFHRFSAQAAVSFLTVFAALVSPAATAESGCQIVIGSCQSAPLSTPEGTGILDRVVIEAFRRIGYQACIESQPCERSL